MRLLHTAPMRYLLLLTGCWLATFLITRGVLLVTHLGEAGNNWLPVFGIGLLYDLGFLAYAAVPLGVYLLLCPPALWRRRGHQCGRGQQVKTRHPVTAHMGRWQRQPFHHASHACRPHAPPRVFASCPAMLVVPVW